MSHHQKRQERHEHDRKARRARQRQSAAAFNRPGLSPVKPRHIIAAAAVVCGIVAVLWVIVTQL